MNKNEIISNIDKAVAAAREAIEAGEKMKAELLAIKDDWWTERGFDKEPQKWEWVEAWDDNRGVSLISKFIGRPDVSEMPFATINGYFKNIAPAKLPREKLRLWIGKNYNGICRLFEYEPVGIKTISGVEFFSNVKMMDERDRHDFIKLKEDSPLSSLTDRLKPGEKMEI